MKSRQSNHDKKRGSRRNDYPELQVVFPERNDVANPEPELRRKSPDQRIYSRNSKGPTEGESKNRKSKDN